jgi:peptidoglycan/LPS O-acetylase OafA/YrhL
MLGATIVFTSVLINPDLQKLLSGRLLASLGRISFALHTFHFIILGSFSSWLFLRLSAHLTYNVNCAVVGITSITVMLVLSYWLTKFIDEPATRAANRLASFWLKSASRITCPP